MSCQHKNVAAMRSQKRHRFYGQCSDCWVMGPNVSMRKDAAPVFREHFKQGRKPLGQRGQSLVEFALLVPVMMLIVLGIAAFGVAFFTKESLENAASEGGRAASIWRPDGAAATNCLQLVLEAVDRATFLVNPVVTVSDNCTDNPWQRIPSGELLTVGLEHDHELFFFGTFYGLNWHVLLQSSVTQMHE